MLLLEQGRAWNSDACPVSVTSDSIQVQSLWQGDGLQLSRLSNAPSRAHLALIGPSSLSEVAVPITADRLSSVRLGLPFAWAGTSGQLGLTLRDAPYPGWHAYADGRETQRIAPRPSRPEPVSRGVIVHAGTRTVDFVYVPASVAAGLFISLLSIMALTALGTSRLRRCAQ
jgi:hypothetical protein